MNKERFGAFIAQRRKEEGLTQRELAESLHLTDKAVSKWERGLSYPDVTVLEPLAERLHLTVGELMACRVGATEKEEPVETLMNISKETVRRERRRSWGCLAGVLVLLAATAALIGWKSLTVSEQRETAVVLTERTADGDWLYVEQEGHLLKLRCGDGVDPDIPLADEGGDPLIYRLTCQWNRLTRTGKVTACEATGSVSLGSIMDVTFEPETAALFGAPEVFYTTENYYPNPYGEDYLCDFRCWTWDNPEGVPRTLVRAEDCVNGTVADVDGDGENEAVVRTRWAEKPYTVYDFVNGEIVETWPAAVPEEVRELLVQVWES